MNCAEFRERVFNREADADAHATACAHCAALRADFATHAELLAGGPRAPENLWLRIEAAIRTRRRAWPRWVAAAAAGILAVLGIFLASAPDRKPKPRLNLVVVEQPPETARSFSGMVPSYDDVDPDAALVSALTGTEGRR